MDSCGGSKLYINKIKEIGAKLSNLDGKSKNHIRGSCTIGPVRHSFSEVGLFFSDIFEKFAMEFRMKGYSENTIQSTFYKVKRFLKTTGVSPCQAGADDLAGYICRLHGSDRYSVRSIRAVINSLKRFYGYLHQNGLILLDPSADLDLPEVKAKTPKSILTAREMESIRKSVSGKSLLKLRDKAIIEVLYSTGLRLSELAGLNITDIDLSAGLLHVHKGKGGRDRQAILNTNAVSTIRDYLECRFEIPDATPALWINYKGNRLSGQMIRKILNKYAKQAGVTTPSHPHAWRHGLATSLLRKGANIIEVKRFLGHVSVRSTQIYTHVLIRDLKDIHRKCHPREWDPIPENVSPVNSFSGYRS